MSDDLLRRAARALSAELNAAPVQAARTRARILAEVANRQRPPFRLTGAGVLAVLVLSGSAALATVGHPLVGTVWRALRAAEVPPSSPRSAPPAARAKLGPRPALPAGPGPAVAAHPARALEPGRRDPAPPSSLALFQRAQRLHFHRRDHARALAAWEAFLRLFPASPLALEARYNRALCLAWLGRRAEARAALRPFADGRVSHYRQAEAAMLLRSLAEP